MNAVRAPFFKGYKFHEWTKKKAQIYISLQSAICVTVGFPLIFGKTNFMEVQKSMKSTKFVVLKKRRPTVSVLLKEYRVLISWTAEESITILG